MFPIRNFLAAGLAATVLFLPVASWCAPQAQPLKEVVVTGTRSPHVLEEVPVETVVISREEIERSPAQNLPQLLRRLPGTSATNLDDTLAADNLRLTFRGLQLNEGYGLILVDGRRVHGGLGAHGDYGTSLNQVPLAMIERIEVVKGASSALYGADAMAGVINIITRPVPDKSTGAVGLRYGSYDVRPRDGVEATDDDRSEGSALVSLGAPVGDRSGFRLQYSHQQDEGSDREPKDTVRDALQGKWHTRLTPNWSVDLDGTLSWSRRDTFAQQERYDRKLDDYLAGAKLNYESGKYAWTLSGSRFFQDFEQGYPGFPHGYRFGDVEIDQVETVLNRFGERHWLTVGAEARWQGLDYTFHNYRDGALEAQVPVKKNIETYSVFAQDEIWLLDQRLILVPGVRYEDHSLFGGELNPKLSASLRTGEATTWRASVGRAFKSPTIRQLYYKGLYRHGDEYIASNPDLDPETAINVNLSVERIWLGGLLTTSLGVFRTDLKDKVVRVDTGELLDGVPIQTYENVEEARIEGVELAFRAGASRGFFLRGSGAWTEAENRDTDLDLPYVPSYTASLAPGYVSAAGGSGAEALLTAVGRQFRDTQNTRRIDPHQVVDLRFWHAIGEQVTAALAIGNIFDSDKGDDEFAFRRGRNVALSLNATF